MVKIKYCEVHASCHFSRHECRPIVRRIRNRGHEQITQNANEKRTDDYRNGKHILHELRQ